MTRAALISLVALLAATGGANAQDHAPGVLRGARPGMASVSGGLTPLVAFSENSMGLTAKSLFVDMNVLAAQTCPATYTSCPDGVSCCLGNCCGGGHCCNTGFTCVPGGCCPTGKTCGAAPPPTQCVDKGYLICSGETFCCPSGKKCFRDVKGQPQCQGVGPGGTTGTAIATGPAPTTTKGTVTPPPPASSCEDAGFKPCAGETFCCPVADLCFRDNTGTARCAKLPSPNNPSPTGSNPLSVITQPTPTQPTPTAKPTTPTPTASPTTPTPNAVPTTPIAALSSVIVPSATFSVPDLTNNGIAPTAANGGAGNPLTPNGATSLATASSASLLVVAFVVALLQ